MVSLFFSFSLSYFNSTNLMESAKQFSVHSMDVELLQLRRQGISRYKSALLMFGLGFVISMSAMMFGYSLTQISTIPIETLVTEYHITFSPSVAQSLLIGITPVGGIFGALLYKYLLAYFTRRTSLFFIAIWMLISVVLVQITTIQTLVIGRFLEGICAALYVSVGPIYLREIVARQLRPQITAIFSLSKVIGIVIAYTIEDIMIAADYYAYSWRILLGFPAAICALQVVLVFFFVPDSPVEMIEKQKFDEAKIIINRLYKPQFRDQVLKQMIEEHETIKKKNIQLNDENFQKTIVQNRKRALWMAIHITTYRQFIGANVLVTFSTQIVQGFFGVNSIATFTGLIVNCIQLLSNAVALFSFTKIFGRRPMILFGSITVTIVNWGLALSLFFSVEYLILTLMCVYMLFFGSTFFPVSWSVPSQIIPPQEAVYANVPGWIATSIVVSCPPIIKAAMPDGNTYPIFLFFGIYGIFGTIVLYKWLVETKGKTYEQIIKEF